MDKSEIKLWLKRVDKTPMDIASSLRMSLQTVQKYLDDKPVRRSMRFAIENYLKAEMQKEQSGPEVA